MKFFIVLERTLALSNTAEHRSRKIQLLCREICEIWYLECELWHLLCELWHLGCELWHLPCELWHFAHTTSPSLDTLSELQQIFPSACVTDSLKRCSLQQILRHINGIQL